MTIPSHVPTLPSLLALYLTLAPLASHADNYFVSVHGADTNDGTTPATAFHTIQKGVDALAPGDILTIGPGEYREAVRREGLGSASRDTIIRAAIPGSVLLRGDVPAPAFEKVDGYRFVHAAPFDAEPQALMENDTLAVIERRVTLPNLEFEPGTFFYHTEQQRLYISTSDMQPPSRHHLSVSITPQSGLLLVDPQRVIVDGLAATGYYKAEPNWHKYYVWGIRLDNPVGCTIRNCTAYQNAGGIAIWGAGNSNVIEHCTAYGNDSQFQDSGGNIVRFGGDHDVIRNCYAYRSGNKGISFYGQGKGPVLHERNIGWGNLLFDIRIKGHGTNSAARAKECVAIGNCMVHDIDNCLFARNGYRTDNVFPPGNIRHQEYRATTYLEFADPDNLDFRLQSTSALRGGGPNGRDLGPYPYEPGIFYVTPEGDNTADGTSIDRAWRTPTYAATRLQPGNTLYIAPGIYTGNVSVAVDGIDVRGRGREPVILSGQWDVADASAAQFRRLHFTGALTVRDTESSRFENCTFGALHAQDTRKLHIEHGVFTKRAAFTNCSSLRLAGNIFAAGIEREGSSTAWCDYNAWAAANTDRHGPAPGERAGDRRVQTRRGAHSIVLAPELAVSNGATIVRNAAAYAGRGPLGTAIGLYLPYRPEPVTFAGPFLHSVGSRSANIEWWTARDTVCELGWGATPACTNVIRMECTGYAGYSLTGLEPGQTYYAVLRSVAPADNNFNVNLQPVTPTNVLSFQVAPETRPPATYYVATNGTDAADGRTPESAWRTVNYAANVVHPGDTVLIAGGIYPEVVVLRNTGEAEGPITFKTMPGEKVQFSGVNRTLCEAFLLNGKHHIRLDGFYFKGHRHRGWSGVFRLVECNDVDITRCFWDGRGRGTPNLFLYTHDCRDILVKNCVIFNGFFGMYIVNTDLRIENSVNMRNWITAMNASGGTGHRIVQKDSIITDSTPFKVRVHLYECGTSTNFYDDNNCYYLRVPDEERKMFLFYADPDVRHFPSLLDRRISLAEYTHKVRPSSSVVANPMFAATAGMEDTREMGKYAPTILVDHLVNNPDLDFPDLFATNPKLMERGIGLQPEAFTDFHFNRGEAPESTAGN